MSDNPFVGAWTYRSLLNNPADRYRFRRARVRPRHPRDQGRPDGAARGTIGGPGWSLELKGARSYGDPMHARFQGTGTVNNEPWVYDYTG